MPFDPTQHHRRSTRLQGYDYSGAGVYFVTLCALGRECLFGKVADETMHLSEAGEIVQEEWLRSPTIRSEVTLDAMVVMPNHLHGVVIIRGVGATGGSPARTTPPSRAGQPSGSPTQMARPTLAGAGGDGTWTTRRSPLHLTPEPGKRSLGALIAGFKAATTKRINACQGTPGNPVWQRNYYDRIVRNEDELWRIREYIANNPVQWAVDRENPVVAALRTPSRPHT